MANPSQPCARNRGNNHPCLARRGNSTGLNAEDPAHTPHAMKPRSKHRRPPHQQSNASTLIPIAAGDGRARGAYTGRSSIAREEEPVAEVDITRGLELLRHVVRQIDHLLGPVIVFRCGPKRENIKPR